MPNALSRESSLYLRKAADHPVDWLPWGETAFKRAWLEDKPILLDIGAMWCHWCHVMDHECYENPEIAALINEHFIAIRVDRDEHPEIDRRYQPAISAIAGEGGWPLTAFLTPDGDAFHGGAYFPPEPRGGQRGMRDLLLEIAKTYRDARPSVLASAQHVAKAQEAPAPSPEGELDASLPETAIRNWVRDFDLIHGGFGEGPYFPQPAAIELILSEFFRSKDPGLERVARAALDSMVRGAIHDQIGGGFHRYSAATHWNAPHFEKLLADNAGLLRLYTRAFTLFQDPLYQEVAERIINWTSSVMSTADGGFLSSQDADTGLGEGYFFTWTLDELQQALTEKECQVASIYYNISDQDRRVPFIDRPLEEVAEELQIPASLARGLLVAARERLYWTRKKRIPPAVDPAVYSASCAVMASSFLEAGRTLNMPDVADRGQRAVEYLIRHSWNGAFFTRRPGEASERSGLLEDQVFPGIALLDVHDDTGSATHLEIAVAVAQLLISTYQDPIAGGFLDLPSLPTAADHSPAAKPYVDAGIPGINPAAAQFFLRLHGLTRNDAFLEVAVRTMKSFARQIPETPPGAASCILALQGHFDGMFEIYVVGEQGDPQADALSRVAWETYRPRKHIHRLAPSAIVPAPTVGGMVEFIQQRNVSMAFVCVEGSCAAPVEKPDDLRNLIYTFNP